MSIYLVNLGYFLFAVMCERAVAKVGLYNLGLMLIVFVMKLNYMGMALKFLPSPLRWVGFGLAVILTIISTAYIIKEM